jgi:hypothetical protein
MRQFTSIQICQAVVEYSQNAVCVGAAIRFLIGQQRKGEGSFIQACYDGDIEKALRLADEDNLKALKIGLNLS